MKTGDIIKFNGGLFEITEIHNEEISKIKRMTSPCIEVDTEQKDAKLKLYGWNTFKSFELVSEKEAQRIIDKLKYNFDITD